VELLPQVSYQSQRDLIFINFGASFVSLSTTTPTIEVATLQAIYTGKDYPIKNDYRNAIQNYNVQPVEVDFYSPESVIQINEATNRTTRGLIPYTILPQDIYGAKMFLLSSLYFKGQWKVGHCHYLFLKFLDTSLSISVSI